jgi:uncharacterized membrane protein
MRLQTQVLIRRPPDAVCAWLRDLSNLPRWEHAVAAVQRAATRRDLQHLKSSTEASSPLTPSAEIPGRSP